MVSDLLLGKERDFLSLPMSYSNGDKQYTEDFRKDSSITREENAAFIAIEESKGINQEYLIPSAITNLERKIKNDRYHLEGSEGAIDLLKSGQISAAYTEILSKSENLDNAFKSRRVHRRDLSLGRQQSRNQCSKHSKKHHGKRKCTKGSCREAGNRHS